MKKILILLVIFTFSCKAQNILPLYRTPTEEPNDTYIKDIDSNFNPFVGIWKFKDSNTEWIIEFKKIQKFKKDTPKINNLGIYTTYRDFIIGEYKYILNGVELINTLPANLLTKPSDSNITGSNIVSSSKRTPTCNECLPDTRFIIAYFSEPDKPGLTGKIYMAKFGENGVEKIRLSLRQTHGNPSIVGEIGYSGPTELTIPDGIYTFVKQ